MKMARFIPDAASQAGTVAGNQSPATMGAFDVKEAFAEGLLPVLKDLPFAQYVELNGAVRYAHYSTAGDATSWKYGATWQVTNDLKFRGSEASATRAPNIAELFTPRAQTFPGISSDVCSGYPPTPIQMSKPIAARKLRLLAPSRRTNRPLPLTQGRPVKRRCKVLAVTLRAIPT